MHHSDNLRKSSVFVYFKTIVPTMGTYLEPCQTSMIEFFFEYISQLTAANHFRKKKVNHGCLTRVLNTHLH